MLFLRLADLVLLLHFGVVLFLGGGLLLIFAGRLRGWGWVRNPAFRWTHLGLMGFVTAESLVGMTCPLTAWEQRLREAAGPGGGGYGGDFIAHWVGRLLFHELPPAFFLGLYAATFALVLGAWLAVPPYSFPRRAT